MSSLKTQVLTRGGKPRVDLLFLEVLKAFLRTAPGKSCQANPEEFVDLVCLHGAEDLSSLTAGDVTVIVAVFVPIVKSDHDLQVVTRGTGEVQVTLLKKQQARR